MIKIIVAISKNRVIGKDNSLIWHLPADLRRFKEVTTGSVVVMGRKTYESIGKPLANRRNVIITRNENYEAQGCEVVNSIEEALLICYEDCFIIGGSEIYKQSLSMADEIYLTEVDDVFDGDSFFPELGNEWHEVSNEKFEADDKNKFNYSFIKYEKYKF
jgi:dihydrofolate reductase